MKNKVSVIGLMVGIVAPVAFYGVMAAEPVRKVDFSKPLLDVKGQPFHSCSDQRPECKKALSLGETVALGLMSETPESAKDDGIVKLRKSMLATRVFPGGKQDLSVEESKLILDTMKNSPQAIVYYRVVEAVDPSALPK